MNEYFPFFCFLDDLLSSIFFTRCLYFHLSILWWEEEKKSIKSIFQGFYLKFEDKIVEIHKHSWLSITWILKKLNSIQTLAEDVLENYLTGPFWAKPSEIHIWKLKLSLSRINFVFCPNNRLLPLWILSYRESTIAAPITSLAIYMLYILYIFIFFSWLSMVCSTKNWGHGSS